MKKILILFVTFAVSTSVIAAEKMNCKFYQTDLKRTIKLNVIPAIKKENGKYLDQVFVNDMETKLQADKTNPWSWTMLVNEGKIIVNVLRSKVTYVLTNGYKKSFKLNCTNKDKAVKNAINRMLETAKYKAEINGKSLEFYDEKKYDQKRYKILVKGREIFSIEKTLKNLKQNHK